MKKLGKFLALLMFCSCAFFLSACGEFTIKIHTNIGIQQEIVTVKKDDVKDKLREKIASLDKDGYEIEGLYFDATYSKEFTYDQTIDSSTDIYVKWRGKEYQLIFDVNGGNGEMANQTIRYNENSTLMTNGFSREGYVFAGWSSSQTATEKQYDNLASIVMDTKGKTLYAVWQANAYLVKFNANGGTGNMADQAIPYDDSAYLKANSFVKTGYDFAGWNTKSDGSGESYTNGQNFTMQSITPVILFAQWNIRSHTLTFDATTGTGTMQSMNFDYNQTKALTTNSFVKVGHSFSGWNTKLDGSGSRFVNGAQFTMGDENVTLYAQWTANTYYVRFDANGGTGNTTSTAIVFNQSKNLTQNGFSRSGYAFSGWNTKDDGSGTSYVDGAGYTIADKDVTLYAQWSANSYNVVFNSNTGIGSMNNQNIVYGQSQVLDKNAFTKLGYSFLAWNTKANGSGTAYNDCDTFTMTTASQVNLYAQWKINTHNIVFDKNTGDGEMPVLPCDFGEEVSLTANVFTKLGHGFANWNTRADGTGIAYSNNARFVMADEDVTLYAQWSANTYYVTFDANGGSGTISNQPIIFGQSANLSSNAFTKEGHFFGSWNTKADGTGEELLENAEFEMTSTGATLFAQWTKENYTISFYNEGALISTLSVEFGQIIDTASGYSADDFAGILDSSLATEGYTYGGFFKVDDSEFEDRFDVAMQMPDVGENNASVSVYLHWAVISSSVAIEYNGATAGNDLASITTSYNTAIGSLPTPTKEGSTFVGWYRSNSQWTDSTKVTAETIWRSNITSIYAKWVENSSLFTIQYDFNSSIAEDSTPRQSYRILDCPFNITKVSKEGYSFAGWKLSSDAYLNGVFVENGAMLPSNEGIYYIPALSFSNISLTANFTPNVYSVEFDANGGNGTMNNLEITFDDSKTLTENAYTKTGHSFNSWNTKADGTGESFLNGASFVMNTTGTILYAQWYANTYTVSFDSNGGNGEMTNQSIVYGQSANLKVNAFTRKGYSFAGWGTLKTGEISYNDEALFEMNVTNCVLYAHWDANDYEISFDGNGATSGTMSNQTATFDSNVNIGLNAFVKTGHVFSGWNTKADGTGEALLENAEFEMTSTGATLFAQWTKEFYNIVFKNGESTILSIEGIEFGKIFNESAGFNQTAFDTVFLNDAPIGKEYYAFFTSDDVLFENPFYLSSAMPDIGNSGDSMTLNLIWKYIERDILVNYNDATSGNSLTKITGVYDSALGTLPTPLKDNYTFIGWYTSNTEWTTETKVTSETIWHNEFFNIYAKWVQNSQIFAITLNCDGGACDDGTSINYSISSGKITLKEAHKFGNDFKGWILEQDAFIGGVKVLSGTKIEYEGLNQIIAENSFGYIQLKATWQIQQHSITFKKQVGGEWTNVGNVLTGDYLANVKALSGYSEQTYMTDMAISGFAFDGWFTSSTVFTNETKFDWKISSSDIPVFAHYIQVLSSPSNISIEQNSPLITWDSVIGAEFYEVRIDGGDIISTTSNSLDSGMRLAVADSYVVEVRACSSYVSVLNENINSAFSTLNFTRTSALQNNIVIVPNGMGGVSKYVVFTGMTYNWTSSAYTVDIANLSNESIASILVTDVETKKKSSLTIGSISGTFTLIIDFVDPERANEEYSAQVVYDADSIAYGETYQQYLTSTNAEQTNYLDKNNPVDFLVGTENGFDFDFVLKKSSTIFSNYDVQDNELITYSFKVKDGENWIDASETEIPTRLTSENVTTYDKVGMFKFDPVNVGKTYKATINVTYSRFGNLSTTYEFTLNDGWNAHTSDQFKAYYGNKNIHNINMVRNIVATLDSKQTQVDGSPINVQSNLVFDNDKEGTTEIVNGSQVTYNNYTGADTGVVKTDGNVYKRAFFKAESDIIIVNGNYCTIDASDIPLINLSYSNGQGSGSDGVNHQTGLISSSAGYDLARPHTGIFRYQVNAGKAFYNNFTLLGNRATSSIKRSDFAEGAEGDALYEAAFAQRASEDSGTLCGFFSETSEIVCTNLIVRDVHHGVRNDGAMKSFKEGASAVTPNNSITEFNYVKLSNAYCNAIYSWEGKSAKLYNSYVFNLNGPAVQLDCESTPTFPIFILDKNTVIDNYMTGTESWFTLWGQASLAQSLKTTLQNAMTTMGASVLKEVEEGSTVTAANFIFVHRPVDITSRRLIEDGTYVENAAAADRCTTIIGGVKSVDENGKTTSTGVKTTRPQSHLSSSDPRVSGGMHAFPITPYVETSEFGAFALAMTELLTNATLQQYMVGYALGNTTTWTAATTVAVTNAGGATLGQLVTETEFARIANNFIKYAVFSNVIKSYSLTTTSDTAYSQVVQGLASNYSTTTTIISAKLTRAMFDELVADNASGCLIVLGDMGSGAGSFMIMKMCESENCGTKVIEIDMTGNSAGGVQVVYIGFGFIDETGWVS